MLVVGVDPGSIFTGFAWIMEKDGHITRDVTCFKVNAALPHRYMLMREGLEGHLSRLPGAPDLFVVERPLDQLPTSGSLQGIFRLQGGYAVIACEIGRLFSSYVHIATPNCRDWMKGREKKDVYPDLLKRYNYKRFTTEDEADALGLADFGISFLRGKYARSTAGPETRRDLPLVTSENAPHLPPGEHGDPGLAPGARSQDAERLGRRAHPVSSQEVLKVEDQGQ